MAKAIRPLAAQEAQEVLSMLSNLAFTNQKLLISKLSFLATICRPFICTIREQRKNLLSAVLFVSTLTLTSEETT